MFLSEWLLTDRMERVERCSFELLLVVEFLDRKLLLPELSTSANKGSCGGDVAIRLELCGEAEVENGEWLWSGWAAILRVLGDYTIVLRWGMRTECSSRRQLLEVNGPTITAPIVLFVNFSLLCTVGRYLLLTSPLLLWQRSSGAEGVSMHWYLPVVVHNISYYW